MTNVSNTRITQILEELISFRSTDANINEKNEIIEYAYSRLSANTGYVNKFYSSDIPSLVYTSTNTKNPKILLQAHLDIVPAADHMFILQKDENNFIGRGVYDMKFAAACFLYLIEELADELSKYDFGIMFTTDEEIGGENGVGYLLEEGYGAEVCILPDGGDNWQLESECNGVWLLDIVAEGKSSHGSRPWEGVNAIEKILAVLPDIKKVFPMNDHDKNTLTISKIVGGSAINQVPDSAKCTLDMRFTDERSYSDKRIQIESIIQSHKLTVETQARLDSFCLDTKNPYIENFIQIASGVYGKPIEFGRSYGASDAHYFNSKGIPTILIRPNGGGAHSDEEWIEKDGLNTFYEVVKAYVKEVAKIA